MSLDKDVKALETTPERTGVLSEMSGPEGWAYPNSTTGMYRKSDPYG